MNRHQQTLSQRNTQKGISLLIALVFLLIITVVAIANMREVSLESRITGNMIEQKHLLNIAESAARDGERQTVALGPHEPRADCKNMKTDEVCLLNRKPEYAVATNLTMQTYSPTDKTTLSGKATWYAQIAPGGEIQGEAENPEYGNMLLGIGIFRYEVNAIASNNGLNSAIRSTVALNAKGRIERE